jgi:hypothetical protein
MSNFGGPSDHDPKTTVVLDGIADDEQALKSLTNQACMAFGKYDQPPSVPYRLTDYVPCRVLIKTHSDPDGRRRGRIQFITPNGVLGYDREWTI